MQRKRVSVVVPVYNVESYIDGCIQSVLSQDYDNIELILVNDGSRDRSGIICEKYAEEHENIVYKYQRNAGVSAARNAGIDLATGEYIVFVDSDDRIKSDMVSLLVDALEKSDSDLCICGYEVVRSDSVIPMTIDQETVCGKENLAEYFAKHFLEAIASSACCKLYKRAFIHHRFNPGFSMGEDLLFNLEYVRQTTKSVAIGETLYIYDKTNEVSLSHIYKESYHEQNLYVFKQWLNWFQEFENIDDTNVHRRIAESCLAFVFHVCGGSIPGKKIDLIKSMMNDDLDASIQKAIPYFNKKNGILLRLIIHKRYRMLLFVGNVYCKAKAMHH